MGLAAVMCGGVSKEGIGGVYKVLTRGDGMGRRLVDKKQNECTQRSERTAAGTELWLRAYFLFLFFADSWRICLIWGEGRGADPIVGTESFFRNATACLHPAWRVIALDGGTKQRVRDISVGIRRRGGADL